MLCGCGQGGVCKRDTGGYGTKKIAKKLEGEVFCMSVFKSYLRQLIRQLKALKKADEEGNKEEVRRIIDELLEDAQDGLEDD